MTTRIEYLNQVEDMKKLHLEGVSLADIGRAYGISRQAVSQRLRKNGYYPKEEALQFNEKLKSIAVNNRLDSYIAKLRRQSDLAINSCGTYKHLCKKYRAEISEIEKNILSALVNLRKYKSALTNYTLIKDKELSYLINIDVALEQTLQLIKNNRLQGRK